jgi:outer membrane protein OmpA-like peptidoglycan-associated protein
MENIMEVTTWVLKGPMLERLSQQTHESEGAIRRGVEQAVPISIAGLAAHTASEQNAEQLLGTLRSGNYPHADVGAIGQTTASPEVTTRLVQSGSMFLRGIMGPNKLDTAVDTIAAHSGVSRQTATTLLGLSAPVVLDAVGKEADARHLDAHGLSQFLAEQGRNATGALPASMSSAFADTRAGAPRVEQRAKSSMNEARERLRATIEDRQQRAHGQPEPRSRRVGAWIAAALAVLAAILLLGRRNAQRPEPGMETPNAGQETPRAGQPEAPAQPQQQPPATAIPQQPAQPQAAQPQAAQPQAPAEQPAAQDQAPAGQQQVGQQQAGQQQAGQQQAGQNQQGTTQEAAPGGVPAAAPVTLSATGGAGALGTFLAGTEPTPKRFVLEGIDFAPDSSDINQNAMLDGVAAQLSQFPNAHVRIEGYTDGSGTSTGNADLSEARANAVRRYLTSRGVNAAQVSAQGRSAEQPLASNDTAEGRTHNRRVELVVTSR